MLNAISCGLCRFLFDFVADWTFVVGGVGSVFVVVTIAGVLVEADADGGWFADGVVSLVLRFLGAILVREGNGKF